ncbi:MAG: hypothetical protein LIO96_01290 [Lachnospiraceae bacterium]|nr:hypothetical protein [Lachnospiraceae bacterium]
MKSRLEKNGKNLRSAVTGFDPGAALGAILLTLFITWIPLIFACYFLSRKNWGGMICMMPVAVSWLTQFAGPIVLSRYMVTYVYEVPLLFAMIFLSKKKGLSEEA